jgi:low affinity Fe/Cu permease
MVLLVQHTQNRDAQAMQIKLNEIIRALPDTRNKAIALEDREPDEAEVFRREFKQIRDEEN